MSGRCLWVVGLIFLVGPASIAQWPSRADAHHSSWSTRLNIQEDFQFQTWVNSFDVESTRNQGQGTISAAQLKVPAKAQSALEKAKKAFRKGKFDEMDRQLGKALTLSPRYSEALAFRAAIELNEKSLDRAKSDAEAAVEYDPNCAAAYFVLGVTYNSLQQFDDAIRALDRAVSLGPGNRWNYYEMARALLFKGDYTGTLRYADRALKLSAKDDLPCVHLLKAGAFVALRNQSSASDELNRIQDLKTSDPNVLKAKKILERMNASYGEDRVVESAR